MSVIFVNFTLTEMAFLVYENILFDKKNVYKYLKNVYYNFL